MASIHHTGGRLLVNGKDVGHLVEGTLELAPVGKLPDDAPYVNAGRRVLGRKMRDYAPGGTTAQLKARRKAQAKARHAKKRAAERAARKARKG